LLKGFAKVDMLPKLRAGAAVVAVVAGVAEEGADEGVVAAESGLMLAGIWLRGTL
jgi:hypothetical protein